MFARLLCRVNYSTGLKKWKRWAGKGEEGDTGLIDGEESSLLTRPEREKVG